MVGYYPAYEDWKTDPLFYGLNYPKIFRIGFIPQNISASEFIDLVGTMYSNATMRICYSDFSNSTVDINFRVYEYFNPTYTYIAGYSFTGMSSFCFWSNTGNYSRNHLVVVDINSTSFGYVHNMSFWVYRVGAVNQTNGTIIEEKMRTTFGNWSLGNMYVPTIFIFIPCMIIIIALPLS